MIDLVECVELELRDNITFGHIIAKVKNPDMEEVKKFFKTNPHHANIRDELYKLPIHCAA